MKKSIRAFAPATVANVGVGFDVLGFSVEAPGDEVEIELSDEPGIKILSITGDEGELPLDAEKNTVSLVIAEYLKHIGKEDLGVNIRLDKKMPLKSGLGSSAASSVVGVYALNELLERPLKQEELLQFAVEGERLACGSAHADNVAPALLGGFVLVRSYSPLDAVKLPTPEDLYVGLIHPHIEVKTSDARKILKTKLELSRAVHQWGNIGGVVASLYREDYDLLGRSLEDIIVEPVRKLLIPGFDNVKKAAMASGALGCSISGSGPSMFALCKGKEKAESAVAAMRKEFKSMEIDSEVFVSKINAVGPRIIE